MISYDRWDREYQENKQSYLDVFDRFMSLNNYENSEQFEKDLAEIVGRKHVVGVASATDALYFSLLAYNIGPGDEVLVTDFSWISSASCISMAGATPVFCDIDLDSYHISLSSIKRMYSEKTKAIIYTHLFGNMTDTRPILEWCKSKGIIFIEDAAQSLGSSLHGICAGTIGDCSSFSFNTNKVIAGINGGGVFMTDDSSKADLVRKIRRHGRTLDFEMLGYNSRIYTLNANIIKLRLQNKASTQQIRQKIANRYTTAFKNLPVYTQPMITGLNHNYHKYVIRFDHVEIRNQAKEKLNAAVHYEKPISSNSMYQAISHRRDTCENSKLAADTVLSLPVHAWLTDQEINNIIESVQDLFRHTIGELYDR